MRNTVPVLAAAAALGSFFFLANCEGRTPDDPPVDVRDRNRTTATLVSYDTCAALHEDLQRAVAEELDAQLEGGGWGWGMEDVDAGGVPPPAADPGGRQEGVDFSGTNVQEAGVDEADFVKTDGYFIYTLNGERLEIMAVPEFGELAKRGTLELEGYPSQMLLESDEDGGRAVVFSRVYLYELPEAHPLRAASGVESDEHGFYWRGQAITKMTVVDLGADRASPTTVRELYLEGSYQTARRKDDAVFATSYAWMDIPGLIYWPELPESYWQIEAEDERQAVYDEAVKAAKLHNRAVLAATALDEFVPRLYERVSDEMLTLPLGAEGCANFAIADDGAARGFTSILSLDLASPDLDVKADHIVSQQSTLYASRDRLIIAEPAHDWWWFWGADDLEEATNLHVFDITEADAQYIASGRVPGLVFDQFQLDEHEGRVRVAATEGTFLRWWTEDPPPPVTSLRVLEHKPTGFQQVGAVSGIAPEERLWASRFTDDRAYLVTFRNIDPLWTIDLSNPTQPQIVGELEIPGVSTYIHPLDEDNLLTIGIAGTDDGLLWGQTQLSLFDISDFANPALASTLNLAPVDSYEDGWAYAWSEAQHEHKAFQYWGPQDALAIPLSTYRYDADRYEYISRLELIHARAGDPLSRRGSIDHSDYFNDDPDAWWSSRDVRRSIFMGDFIYAISDRAVTAHHLDDLSLSAQVALPGTDGSWHYW
jgi:hypothetical protein